MASEPTDQSLVIIQTSFCIQHSSTCHHCEIQRWPLYMLLD